MVLMKKETLTFDTGKYVGEVKEGKLHGKGTYTYVNGDKYVGEYKDGEMNGQGTSSGGKGKTLKGQWKNGEFVK